MTSINTYRFKNGLTVRELKEIIRSWPDKNDRDEDMGVWIETSLGLSNQVTEIWPLDVYHDGSANILLCGYPEVE